MNHFKLIPALLVMLTSIFACTKSKTASPASKQSTTIDSARLSNPNGQSVGGQYPYTDTFAGTLHVVFIYDYYSNLDTSHTAYKFTVTHLAQNQVVINSVQQVRIMNEELYWLTDKPDTVVLDANSNGNGALLAYDCFKVGDGRDQVLSAAFSLQNGGRTLSVSWDNTYFPVPGTCDGGESKGEFLGSMK